MTMMLMILIYVFVAPFAKSVLCKFLLRAFNLQSSLLLLLMWILLYCKLKNMQICVSLFCAWEINKNEPTRAIPIYVYIFSPLG